MDVEGKEVAVIGAGVVGLSTALCIQEAFPQLKVTIFADKFERDTLSSGAGGIFRPEITIHHDEGLVRKWLKDSLSHFVKIARSPEAGKSGVQLVSGFQLSSSPSVSENALLKELLPEYRKVTNKELEIFPKNFKSGYVFATVITDCWYYLPWMRTKFEKAGGKVVKKHISNLCELPDNFFVVVNCTGLGARELLQDDLLVPIRGQTIKVKAPWIKQFYYGDGVYIIPGTDYVTLGGIKDYGCGKTDVNPYQRQYILDKCIELVPSLKDAEVLWDWVGIRPHRPSVRVDACVMNKNGNYRVILNNYGHGGHGVALSHGTACEVTRMLQKVINNKAHVISKL